MLPTLTLGAVAIGSVCGYYALQQQPTTINQGKQIEIFERELAQHRQMMSNPSSIPITMRRAVVSYDLFDTLITRCLPDPDFIFKLVEARSGKVGFAAARKRAEAYCGAECTGNIHHIYDHLTTISGEIVDAASAKELRELEWQLELEHMVLIQSNVKELVDTAGIGIIIVSDTFYSAVELRELLTHLKFPRLDEISIFASRSGKRDGWIWPLLGTSFDIQCHTGDNFDVDVKRPLACIPKVVSKTKHSRTAHTLSQSEILMFKLSSGNNPLESPERQFGSLIRRLTMANPYDFDTEREKFFWYRLHASYTVPLFWFFIRTIDSILRSNNKLTHIAAVSRDCILLEPYINRYILGDRGIFIESDGSERQVTLSRVVSSRRVLREQIKNPNQDYLSYLKEALGGNDFATRSLVLDINGTYYSLSAVCLKYMGGDIPQAHYLSAQMFAPPPYAKHKFSVAIPFIDTNAVERLNVTRNGSLVDWVGSREEPFGGPVCVACEYNDAYIDIANEVVLHDAPLILRVGEPCVMPSERSMIKLLENLDSLSDKLRQVNLQTTLPALCHTGRTSESQIILQLAAYYARVLTPYTNRHSEKNPMTILDITTGLKTTLPWAEYMNKRARVTQVKPSELEQCKFLGYDLGCLTVGTSTPEKIFTEVWPYIKTYLGIHVTDDNMTVDWTETSAELKVKWKLNPQGSLYIFSRKVS